ncbi:SEP domain protein [Aphelenchoides fujianensis]|nr:SEP domain protein [Aphelenchoides fujianensis]
MPNIRTLDSLNAKQSDGEQSDDDRQGFFVGGSDHSGQQVLGPGARDRDVTGDVFNAARRAGAQVLSSEESAAIHDRFGAGVGHSLGGGSSSGSSGGRTLSGQPPADPHTVRIQVTFWENGFSVDRGPLRPFEDAANRSFLTQLQQGRIPDEIQQQHPGKVCDIDLVRRPEPYQKPPMVPFAGTGYRLGGS